MLRAVGNPLTSLSGRERVVAAKFAEGMTYREIGETLFIAPTTVRTHLSAIYRKLGVRSKVALAALLADYGGQAPTMREHDGLSADELRATDHRGDPVRQSERGRILDTTCRRLVGRHHRRSRALSRSSGDRTPDHAFLQGPARRRPIHRARVERRLCARRERCRQPGRRCESAVQLVDAGTGVALWTTRYDRTAEDLFAMQDSVTENVINVLGTWCGQVRQTWA